MLSQGVGLIWSTAFFILSGICRSRLPVGTPMVGEIDPARAVILVSQPTKLRREKRSRALAASARPVCVRQALKRSYATKARRTMEEKEVGRREGLLGNEVCGRNDNCPKMYAGLPAP